jgi:predicted RNA-binding protein (virulence factor B family)
MHKLKCDEYIKVGLLNNLQVDRLTDHGLFLSSLKDDFEILLPNNYVKPYMDIYSIIEVFVYTESEDRIIATTEVPKVMLNQFASLEVIDICDFGVFLDAGLQKDLLLHNHEQLIQLNIGDKVVIYLDIDKKSNRLFATQKINKFILKDNSHLQAKQKVNLLLFDKTPLGYMCIVDNSCEGLIFRNEVFGDIAVGDELTGYIKKIREDGKIDLSLSVLAEQDIKDNVNESKVISILKQQNNSSNLTAKSQADDIYKEFGMSKKVFKRVLNSLDIKGILQKETNGIKLK